MARDRECARSGVLRTFEWCDGDARLTPVFHDAETLASLGPGLTEPFHDCGITAVVAPEARGFVLGALCAVSLGVGFVAARKPGVPRPGGEGSGHDGTGLARPTHHVLTGSRLRRI